MCLLNVVSCVVLCVVYFCIAVRLEIRNFKRKFIARMFVLKKKFEKEHHDKEMHFWMVPEIGSLIGKGLFKSSGSNWVANHGKQKNHGFSKPRDIKLGMMAPTVHNMK